MRELKHGIIQGRSNSICTFWHLIIFGIVCKSKIEILLRFFSLFFFCGYFLFLFRTHFLVLLKD